MTEFVVATEVKIVDAVNTSRVLGFILKSDLPTYRYDMFRVAVMPSMSVCNFRPDAEPPCMVECYSVEFIAVPYHHDHWSTEVLLKTYTPLDTLMMLRSFRLSGESRDEMKMRRHFRGH